MDDGGARGPERVLIGVPTFRRPDDLSRLLAALAEVVAHAIGQGHAASVDVLVVDNDPQQSAREAAETARLAPRYVVEPSPGVAAVRNRVLAESAGYDLLAFIDDDETPADAGWLARLLDTRAHAGAHAVAGPVQTVAEGGLDPWVQAGGFFARAHRRGLRTGEAIERAATNNLLLDLACVRRAGLRFDERFGRSGGEDSLFTAQLHDAGARMVWCADALVIDHLPPERRTRAHALARTRGMEAVGVRVELARTPSPLRRLRVRARAILIGAARCASGAVRTAVARVTRSETADAVARRQWARGVGALAGGVGRHPLMYGDAPHTRPDRDGAGQVGAGE